MGIFPEEVCESRPELRETKWGRCVNFTSPSPTWHIVERKFQFPMLPKLTLEYRVYKNSGKISTKNPYSSFSNMLENFLLNHLDLRFLSVLAMDEISFRDCTKEWIEYNNPKPKMKPTPPTTTTKKITTTVRTTTTTSTTTSRTTTKRSLTTPRFLSTLRFRISKKLPLVPFWAAIL